MKFNLVLLLVALSYLNPAIGCAEATVMLNNIDSQIPIYHWQAGNLADPTLWVFAFSCGIFVARTLSLNTRASMK